MNLWFEGNMPENSASIVKLGGGYATYRDYSGNIYDGYEKDATTVTDTAATFTMICSNLEWTTSIVGVAPKNVLWDRYNYVTYKITIKIHLRIRIPVMILPTSKLKHRRILKP